MRTGCVLLGQRKTLGTRSVRPAGLREALSQPESTDRIQPDPCAIAGDLARTALAHLPDSEPTTVPLVEDAISLPP